MRWSFRGVDAYKYITLGASQHMNFKEQGNPASRRNTRWGFAQILLKTKYFFRIQQGFRFIDILKSTQKKFGQ